MANHQTNFTSNFGEMGETGNAAFVLNVNGVNHTYHPIGSDISVDVATVRRILATTPNLAQSIAGVLSAGGYPILVYDGSEYGYIRTSNGKYVFTCINSLDVVKQVEVDAQAGTITAGSSNIGGVTVLSRTDDDLFFKITAAITSGRMPIISDTGTYYQLIAKTAAIAQFGRIVGTGVLEVLTVNISDQITSSSFTFVQDPYYVHTDNNFTNEYKTAVEANTAARHTHSNKSVLDGIEQSDIDNWDSKLGSTGDASNTTSTFTKGSGDTSPMTSGGKLSAIFTAISSFFASLKALAFKDTVSDSDIDSVEWSKVSNKPTKLSEFTDDITQQNYIASGTGSDKPASGAAVAQAIQNISSFKYESIGNTAVDLNDKLYANEYHAYVWTYANRNNVANKPTNDGGVVLSFAYYSNTYGVQIAMDGNNYEKPLYVRFKAANQWGSWIPFRDASWINSGTFGTDRIADDAITADKVKDDETLPVNVSGSAYSAQNYDTSTGTIKTALAAKTDCVFPAAAYGYTLLFTVGFNNTNDRKGTISFRVHTSLSMASPVILEGRIGANSTGYVAMYYTVSSSAENRYKLCYKTVGDNTEVWLIDNLASGPSERRTRVEFIEIQGAVTVGNNSTSALPSGLIDFAPGYLKNIKISVADGPVGSTSIPVHVDANGQVQPCNPSLMTVGNATKWDGHAISIGTVVSSTGTISIA